MAKILLVEDDNNLREIYEARLMAEGYVIISARDGEEALSIAIKEKPDLIISDVMMPKISGFDMLDILRSTEEIKNVKVIMMTALSQAEDKERAKKLGADRYLVKSQVTLEDVAKVAKEVLEGTPAPATTEAESKPESPDVAHPETAPAVAEPEPTPAPAPEPVVTPSTPNPPPVTVETEKTEKKIISPISDPNEDNSAKLHQLAEKEEEKEAIASGASAQPGATTEPSATTPAKSDSDSKVDPGSIAL